MQKHSPQKAERRLDRQSSLLVLEHIFFGALKSKMDFREDNTEETMATDGEFIYWNRNFVSECTDDELRGVIAHEVMHPAMLHHVRRGGREPKLWNDAGDYEINPILIDSGFKLPEGGLLDARFAGKTAEQIYEILRKEGKGGKGKPPPGGAAPGQGQPGGGRGQPGTGPQGKEGKRPAGQVRDAKDPAASEPDWQIAVQQAAKVAQMHGSLPGSLVGMIAQRAKPVVDWKSVLHKFVQQHSKSDYSFSHPNRRYTHQGIYLPSIRGNKMPAIGITFDSSGSTQAIRGIFISEIEAAAAQAKPEAIHILMCDAHVHGDVQTFEPGDDIASNLQFRGGGGTSFVPAFDYVERHGLELVCMLYLTDCEGDYPKQAPEYDVLWCCPTPYDRLLDGYKPPFGEYVHIEEYER